MNKNDSSRSVAHHLFELIQKIKNLESQVEGESATGRDTNTCFNQN